MNDDLFLEYRSKSAGSRLMADDSSFAYLNELENLEILINFEISESENANISLSVSQLIV